MATRQFSLLLLAGLILALGAAARAEPTIGDKFTDPLRSGGTSPEMVVIPDGMFVLGGGWALFMPLLLFISNLLDGIYPQPLRPELDGWKARV